jgi:putative N6-adenine-specific DNA methylase
MQFFATAAKGLEELVAAELAGLGIRQPIVEKGGVRFSGDLADCYRANLWLRTAQRILLPIGEFQCETQELLYERVRELPWMRYLNPDMTLAVNCNLRDSDLKHSGFVALKTKDAIVDAMRDRCGRRPSVDTRDPDLSVNVHLARNRCTVSLDTSGAGLDKRGYRLDRKEAPLRETLAAAIVELSGWDGTVPLVDPMCGSGTIPIEAALKASCRPPGLTRPSFGFQRWPEFEPAVWQGLIDEARALCRGSLQAPVAGSDASAGAIRSACQNASRAGVERLIDFRVDELSRCNPPAQKGVLVFNPPYGVRLGEEEALKPLYREIGDVMKRRFSGYTAYLLTGSPELAKHVGLKASRRIVLFNGPIECRLLRYELY